LLTEMVATSRRGKAAASRASQPALVTPGAKPVLATGPAAAGRSRGVA
jgi:hypothetical protein